MQVLTELYQNVLFSSILANLPRGSWGSAKGASLSDPCLDHWLFVSCSEGPSLPLPLRCTLLDNVAYDSVAQMVQLTALSFQATSLIGALQVTRLLYQRSLSAPSLS